MLVLAATAASTVAQAGKINLDMRMDSDNATFNDDAAKPGYQKYYFQTGRVDFTGNATEDLSYRLRLRFDKDQGTVNKRDNVNNTVDLAYLGHKMGDLTVIAGKFDASMNGFEGATSGADLYFKSTAYNAALRYGTGIGASYAFGDHSLTLAHMNALSDEVVGSDLAQTNGTMALIYKGSIMDKSLNFIASHHQTHKANDKDGTYGFTTVGVKFEQPAWFAGVDVNSYSLKNQTTADTTDTVMSTVVTGGYNITEELAAKLKYEMSSTKINTSTTAEEKHTINGYGLALEYKPIKDTNFRYHVAYTSVANKTEVASTSTTPTENHFIIGARLNADFLK